MPYKDPIKRREAATLRMRRFRERHKDDEKYLERRAIENRKYHYKHKKEENERSIMYHKNNRDVRLLKMKEYSKENKKHLSQLKNERNKIRRRTDDNFLIKSRLRCLLYNSLKLYGEGKRFNSSKYGIDFNLICQKLGPCPGKREEWHIDHKIPVSRFDLRSPEGINKAFAPTNFQWLPAIVNIKKSNKLLPKIANY